MATIRIKRRRTGSAGPGNATLKNAELAFNELDNTLYYGKGLADGQDENTAGGPQANEIIPIAGDYIFAEGRTNTWSSSNTFSKDTSFSDDVTVTNELTAGSLVVNNDIAAGSAAYAYGTAEDARKLLATTEYVDTVAGRTSGIPTYPITLRPRLASTGPVGTTETVQGGGTYDYKVAYAGKYVRVAPAADANVCAASDLYFGDGSSMPDSRIVFDDCTPAYTALNTIVGDNSYLLFLPFSAAEITAQSSTTGTTLFYGSVKTAGQLPVSAVFDPNNGYSPYSEDQKPHGLGHSISGYQVQNGDRVLISNAVSLPATDPYGNMISPHEGIWVARSGAWERPVDWDSHADYVPFKTVRVTAGDLAGFVFYPKTYYAYNSSLSDAEKFAEITWWRYPTPGLWRAYREPFISATGDQTWFTFHPEQNVCDAEAWVSQGGVCESYTAADGKKFLVAAGDYAGKIFSLSTPGDFYALPNAQGVYAADLNQPVLSFTETGSTVTTSAWSLSGTNYAIDGIPVALGDVVLLKNETDQTKNGLWVVNAGAWTRHPDYDTWPELRYGSYVSPSSGLNNKDKPFILVTPDEFTIGTSNIVFVPFSQATALSWGAGLQKIGSTVSVKANTATGVVVTEAGVGLSATGGATASGVTWARVAVDQYGRVTAGNSKIVVDTIQIGNGGLNNSNVATWLKDLTLTKFLALFAENEQTGTAGKIVLSTSPTFITSVVAGSESLDVFNTTATTVNAFGAGTSVSIGATTGTTTVKNNLDVDGALTVSTTANVTAGSNSQGQAPLTADLNIITTAAATPSAVTLPSPDVGRRLVVINSTANPVKVYPSNGKQIDALAANAAVDLPPSGQIEFLGATTSLWYSSAGNSAGGGSNGGGYTTTATSATAVTLTATSAYYQFFTGSAAQTLVLPNTTSLSVGRAFEINNNSSGLITVKTSASTADVVTVPAGHVVRVTCVATASPGTAAAAWSADNLGANERTGTGKLVFDYSPTLNAPNIGNATAGSITFESQDGNVVVDTTGLFYAPAGLNVGVALGAGLQVGELRHSGNTVASWSDTTFSVPVSGGISTSKIVIGGDDLTIDGASISWAGTEALSLEERNLKNASGAIVLSWYDNLYLGEQTALVPNVSATGITVTFPATSGTLALLDNNLGAFSSTTSSQLAAVISDETGSGKVVFSTSPTFTTSVVAGSESLDVFNTTATTVNAFGAATTINIGAGANATTTISSTRASTLSSNGALVVTGGLGVGGAVNIAGTTTGAVARFGYQPTNDIGFSVHDDAATANFSVTCGGNVVAKTLTLDNNLSVAGNATIGGNLTVNGTTTVLNTNTLQVNDKNIELAKVTAKTGLQATLATGTNVVTLTAGDTNGLIPGQSLSKTGGTGAFGTNPVILAITSATTFTVGTFVSGFGTLNHATAGAITFSVLGTASPATANGAGLTVADGASSSRTFNLVNYPAVAWSTGNASMVIGLDNAYYIGTASVLSATTLGSGVVNSSLTSVGVIGAGTWQGTAVGVGYGGTGLTAAVSGLLKGNGSAYSAATAGTDYVVGDTQTVGKIVTQTSGTNKAALRIFPGTVEPDELYLQLGDVWNTAGVLKFRSDGAGGAVTKTIAFTDSNISGTAGNVSGTVAIANGGTGQTDATAAFDALAPTTTLGDIVYRGASNNVRLAGNTTSTKKFLTQTGNGTNSAAPGWNTIVGGDIEGLTLAFSQSNTFFTANGQTFGTATTKDAIVLKGGTAGTNSRRITLVTPDAALSDNYTIKLPAENGTLVTDASVCSAISSCTIDGGTF